MANTMDMTRGKPLGLLVSFAVPIFLSSVFQALYSVADSAVVGQFLGVDAFAAVGAAGNVSWMVLDVILGLTQGFGILYAQRFGAHDGPEQQCSLLASLPHQLWHCDRTLYGTHEVAKYPPPAQQALITSRRGGERPIARPGGGHRPRVSGNR